MTTEYRFLVEDITTRQLVAQDLPDLNDGVYEDVFLRPGSLTGTIPVDSPDATEELLDPGRRAIYVMRNGRIDWGGVLWEAPRIPGRRDIPIRCEGWFGYWDHRYVRRDRVFTNVDKFTIVQQLVNDAQDEIYWGDGYDLAITVTWDALSGVLATYDEQFRPWTAISLGEAIRVLASNDDGFDFAMQYSLDAVNNRINKTLKLFYPRKGRDTGHLFEFEVDPPHPTNVISWGRSNSAYEMAWAGEAWGDGSEATRLKSAAYLDAALRNVYPPLEDAPQRTGVTQQATLDDWTTGYFERSNRPLRLPVITVDPNVDPLWGNYELGDTVDLRIDDGFGSVGLRSSGQLLKQPYRFIGYRMDTRLDTPTLTLDVA